VPFPKGNELEAGHRQLRNLESLSIPSGLPESAGNILDGVIIELSEDIEGCDHLVVVEGFSCPLAKQKMLWNM
jgi:hypothetical protein